MVLLDRGRLRLPPAADWPSLAPPVGFKIQGRPSERARAKKSGWGERSKHALSVSVFALACLLSLWSSSAFALDPALDISQYAHTAWKIRDGFSAAPINVVAQTPDGYLWLGTAGQGLMRFDGVRTKIWQPPAGASLPNNRVRALLASRDGTLWIGTIGGLASLSGGKFRTYPEFDGRAINALVQDREGTVWVGGNSPTQGFLCALRNTGADCTGEDGRFGEFFDCLYEDTKGTLWALTADKLWRWKPGPPTQFALPSRAPGLHALTESASGAILVMTLKGIFQLADGKLESFALPGTLPTDLFRDRDGALWIGTTDHGLLHVHNGRTDAFGRLDGLSGDFVASAFEDREGNIWVPTFDGGLDRFRALPATTYSAAQGLSGGRSLLAARDGGIWITTREGLYRWRDGRFSVYRPRGDRSFAAPPGATTQSALTEIAIEGLPKPALGSLFEDSRGRLWLGSESGLGYLENQRFVSVSAVPAGFIDSIAEDKQGNIWVAYRDQGPLRISKDLEARHVSWPNIGKPGDWWRIAADPVDRGVWLGSFAGGLIHLVDGAVRASYSAADGLAKGIVNDLRVAADGTVWAATEGGLSRVKAGRIATLNGQSGLPCDRVFASVEDQEAMWIYTGCGLARIVRADLDAWAAAVDQGKPVPSIRVTVLDSSDGVLSAIATSTPHLAIAGDGKVWFPTVDGITSVDPKHMSTNTLPPPVHVEQVVADRIAYDPSGPISLPPLVRDLTIDYTGLSLVAPEKMQFRYKLEGRDRDWEEAGNRRQAFYTDLAPGNYRFRVIASNNSGVWNEEGASLAFSIAPAYWQTSWFFALCTTAFVALLWGIYRLRVRQLVHAQAIEKRHREMEMELAHANRLATMGQLTASIAHEVNQPLGATITNVQAAQRWLRSASPDPTEVQQALDQAVKAGNRAADVIARVRRLAKKAPAPEENVSLNEVIEEILTITHGEVVKHGTSVSTELAAGLPTIKADRVELQQVLLNLVVNAIQAMSNVTDGNRDLTIRSQTDGSGGVIVSVIDTGPGLEPELRERIFQPFYTSKEGGLGMGLSICRSIVESYGGTLWASANSPRGAVFQFTLPHTRPF
jgi:signal transduction histidine kinase/ligand-binding sensor domain-containing protein